jgi:hypothetical protein
MTVGHLKETFYTCVTADTKPDIFIRASEAKKNTSVQL